MSQFFDQASLVMIPSGYKNGKVYSQKPLSADGELTFTRNSDATRVNADGLVEKVRTNLLLQSNQFDTTWTAVRSTTTSGQSGYDGSSDAWLFESTTTANSASLTQTNTTSSVQSLSVYAKAGTSDWLRIRGEATPSAYQVYFNLSTGSLGSTSSIIDASITAVGGGWYRCYVSANATLSTAILSIANGDNNVTTNSGDSIYIQNAQLEAGDIATDYIPTTTSARSTFAGITVDGTSVPNVPRLDYSGGATCPSLILEPQRVNDVVNNTALNNHTSYNASWGVNVAVAPTGYQEAEKLIENTSNSTHFWGAGLSYTSGTTYTLSVYIKAAERDEFLIQVGNPSVINFGAVFNLSTKVVNNLGSGTALMVDAGNGWYRCIIQSVTALSTGSTNLNCFLRSGGTINYTGDGTSGAYFWGVQREIGSYPTSLILTEGSAVTRLADDMDTTFASPFATDGGATFFLELDAAPQSGSNSTAQNLSIVFASGDSVSYNHSGGMYHRWRVNAGGAAYYQTVKGQQDNSVKMAIKITASSFTAYSNGSIDGTPTSISGNWASATDLSTLLNEAIGIIPVKKLIFFPTALSDSDLATLTA